MKPPCEIVVKYIMPALRALIAKKLIEEHGFSQIDAATKLGMTQSAMSRYLALERGHKIKVSSKLNKLAENIAVSMAKDDITPKEAVLEICEICIDLRKKGDFRSFQQKSFTIDYSSR